MADDANALRRALEAANAKKSYDQIPRKITADELRTRLPPQWAGEYCPGCQLPLKEKPCWTCEDKKKKDEALLLRWKEELGGERAWTLYTEEKFVKTAYNHAAFLAAQSFTPRQNLLLIGPAGTGKSHLRAIAVRPWVMRGTIVKTVFMQEELGQARAQIRLKDEVSSRISAMVRAPVLCIEDLGVEKPSEWVVNEWYYPIIDGRYRLAKPGLIVTMNHSFDQLREYWHRFDPHGRVVSRLREVFRDQTYSLAGERDWRI